MSSLKVVFVAALSVAVFLGLCSAVAFNLGYKAIVEGLLGPLAIGAIGVCFVSIVVIDVWHTPWGNVSRSERPFLYWLMTAMPLAMGATLIAVSVFLII
jgi:hypothetical protein